MVFRVEKETDDPSLLPQHGAILVGVPACYTYTKHCQRLRAVCTVSTTHGRARPICYESAEWQVTVAHRQAPSCTFP